VFQNDTTKEDAMNFARLVIVSILVITVPTRVSANAFSLGGHALGEKLSDFKRAYPSAVCGSSLHQAEVANNSDVDDKKNLLGCCLDDPGQIAAFSTWTIVSAAHCHVFATLYQERLIGLRFVVSVSDIDVLLAHFTKEIGRATLNQTVKFDGVHPRRLVAWSNGIDVLSLVSATIPFDEESLYPVRMIADPGSIVLEVVVIHLCSLDKSLCLSVQLF
jgi:hypothetical protein